jgi:hypothetical protein
VVPLAAVAALVGGISCGNTEDPRTAGVYTLALSDKTTPAFKSADGQSAVYEVQVQVVLPLIEKPKLTTAVVDPYTEPVWYTPSDVQVQCSFVVTNLGDTDVTAEVLLDGWNEFIRYVPKVSVDDEGNLQEDLSTNGRRVIVPAKSRIQGVFSYDDLERVAMDLATIMNEQKLGVTPFNPFHVVEVHTKLLDDVLTKPYVPSVIDGITGFDLSLRTTSQVKLELEATLEVIDHGGFLVTDGSSSNAADRYPANLTIYNPVVVAPPM